ncbi:Sentrin-specific protease 6 [Dissostichus eleginoides]|uniref:Sentrin-specific protease 6 n=1 Tax=Dissostichus eleginoides TaxID=100907 RepID=A0AAD9B535_DISEL|nr:Sentrin-specific protease 6 [Dissostichus eleginoides]
MASPFKIPKKKQGSDSAPLFASRAVRLQSPPPLRATGVRPEAAQTECMLGAPQPTASLCSERGENSAGTQQHDLRANHRGASANHRGGGSSQSEPSSAFGPNGMWRPKRASDRLLSPPQKKNGHLTGSSSESVSVEAPDSLAELRAAEEELLPLLRRRLPVPAQSHAPFDVIENYCDVIENYCDVTESYCDVIENYCDVIENSCDVIENYCDVIQNYCDVINNSCDVTESYCDVIEADAQQETEAGTESALRAALEFGASPPSFVQLRFSSLHAGLMNADANGELMITEHGISIPLKGVSRCVFWCSRSKKVCVLVLQESKQVCVLVLQEQAGVCSGAPGVTRCVFWCSRSNQVCVLVLQESKQVCVLVLQEQAGVCSGAPGVTRCMFWCSRSNQVCVLVLQEQAGVTRCVFWCSRSKQVCVLVLQEQAGVCSGAPGVTRCVFWCSRSKQVCVLVLQEQAGESEGASEQVEVSVVASQLRGYGLWDGGVAQGGSLLAERIGPAPSLLFLWVTDAQASVLERSCPVCCFLILVLEDQLQELQAALLASILDMTEYQRNCSSPPLEWTNGLLLLHSAPPPLDQHLLGLLGHSGKNHLRKSNLTPPGLLLPTRLIQYPAPPSKGRISVTKEDLFRLRDGEFLNDVIIDFYLKYLILEGGGSACDRSHVFSSFFYKQLSRRRAAGEEDAFIPDRDRRHQRVKTWTRHVDIFSKDFLFVPVNQEAHWFLVVVCFPGLEEPQHQEFTCAAGVHGAELAEGHGVEAAVHSGDGFSEAVAQRDRLQADQRSFLQNPVVHFDLPLRLENWFPRQRVRQKREEIRGLILDLHRAQKHT